MGSSPADCIQIDAPSNVVGGSKPHDVAMSDTEHSSKSELAKQLFVERTKGFGIPQLERLYTRIMMGVFETKYPEHRNNLNPNCVSSFKQIFDPRCINLVEKHVYHCLFFLGQLQ